LKALIGAADEIREEQLVDSEIETGGIFRQRQRANEGGRPRETDRDPPRYAMASHDRPDEEKKAQAGQTKGNRGIRFHRDQTGQDHRQ